MPKRHSSSMEFEDMRLQNDVLKDTATFPQAFFHGANPKLSKVSFRRTGCILIVVLDVFEAPDVICY
jgi:hypothetical protein